MKRKLEDLRVIDLKGELEKRGLDKTGIKATLIERLKQAIESEGHDVETYDFVVAVETSVIKSASPKKTTSSVASENESNEKDHTFESFADLVPTEDENGETVNLSNNESTAVMIQQSCDKLTTGEDYSQHAQDSDDKVELLTQEFDNQSKNDEEMAIDYEEEMADDEEMIEADTEEHNNAADESISVNADHADNDNGAVADDAINENEEEAEREHNEEEEEQGHNQEEQEEDEIPNPEQVEPSSMFTAEDTIRLHEAAQLEKGAKIGGASLTDESNSMYVNPDDTLSEMNGLSTTTASNNIANSTNNISTINEEPSVENDEKLAINVDVKDKNTENEQNEIQGKNEDERGENRNVKPEPKKENEKDKEEKAKSAFKDSKQTSTKSVAEKHPENSIWVSGIPSTIKAADLKSLFSKHGRVVSAKVVKVKCKGMIQWYGNLVMSSTEETSNCITNLHRTELHGKSISVERGSGSYPPKRSTSQTQADSVIPNIEASKTPVVKQGSSSLVSKDDKKKSLASDSKSPSASSPAAKAATTELNKPSTNQKSTTTKKSPPSREQSSSQKDEKKKSETTEKSKEKDDKRARSSSKSIKSRTDRSSRSKERRSRAVDTRRSTTGSRRQVVSTRPVYSNSNRSIRGSRGAISSSLRGGRGRFPPPPERRHPRGGFRGRGSRGAFSTSSTYRPSYPPAPPPTALMSLQASSFSRPSAYRPPPGPPAAQAMIDIRRDQREKEMMERMRQKEQEHKQREEMLRLEREKEKLKWERERLEREKLEIQQMRMQAAYERNAIYATPQLLTAGVKRAYEGLDPYASQPEPKRASYSIQETSPQHIEKISGNSRRTPTRSYPSGGRNSDSYHRNSGSRYEGTPRSSRDIGNGKQSSSSFNKSSSSSYKLSSSRRSDAKSSSRNSRYSPPPSSSRRGGGRGGRQEDLIAASSSAKSWSASGSSLPASYSQSRNSGSSGMPGLSIGTSLASLNDWSGSSGVGVVSPTSAHWRALSSTGATLYTNAAQQSASLSAYNNLSSSVASQPYSNERFDAYRFSSSSKRF